MERYHTSGNEQMPKGTLSHRYDPNAVLNVFLQQDSVSRRFYQKPYLASTTVNFIARESRVAISSTVGIW